MAQIQYRGPQQRALFACCTITQQQVSFEAAATRRHHPGPAIGESWRLGLRSSHMQSTPVGTAPRKNQEPSAEITMHGRHFDQQT